MRRTVLSVVWLSLLCLLLPQITHAASDSRRIIPTGARGQGQGERRVALIIGNAAYQDASARLQNPVNDARSMEEILQKSGFEVITRTNTDRRTLYAAVKEFGQKLKKSDVGLFYYAGHGVQIESANYLLPVDLKLGELNDGDDLRRDAYPLAELLDRMREANTRNIVILDACRDNPFSAKGGRSSSRGLAKIATPPETAILYATDFGNTAGDGAGSDNGIFTRNLVQAIGNGLELVDLMRNVQSGVRKDTGGRQSPIFDGLLSVSFYFTAPVTVQQPAASHAADAEREAWGIIKDSNDPADFRSFMKEFPNGSFAGTARLKLGQLEKKQTTDNAVTKAERDRLTSDQAEADRKVSEQVQIQPRQVISDVKNRGNEKLSNRYAVFDNYISDNKSNKCWMRNIPKRTYSNSEAIEYIYKINKKHYMGFSNWRLPKRNEVIELITSLHRAADIPDLADRSLLTIMTRNGFVDFEPENYWIFSGKNGLYGAWVPIWYLDNKNGESKFDVINNHLKENKVKIWPVRDCK